MKNRGVYIGLSALILAPALLNFYPANAEPQHYGAGAAGSQPQNSAGEVPNVEHYGASVVNKSRQENSPPSKPASNTAVTYGNSTVTLRQSDCRLLARHVPAADVAFKPGDAGDGRKVAPADIHPQSEFGKTDDLTFTFSARLNRPLPTGNSGNLAGDVLGEAPIGKIDYHNGVVSFNGMPLGDDQLQGLSEGCRSVMNKQSVMSKPAGDQAVPRQTKVSSPSSKK
jgi:hypothetical protein